VINQIRAFLLERGISFRKGPASLRRQMPEILENADETLSTAMRRLLDFLWQEWKGLQVQIESLNTDLEQIASSDPSCVRLEKIPGVGPMVSTEIVSAIGNGGAFKKGREFAAWLGLVPRQWSTGGKTKLLGITKRGNPYLRKMFIHGARAAVLRVKREGSSLGTCMSGLETRTARNVVIVPPLLEVRLSKLALCFAQIVVVKDTSYFPREKRLDDDRKSRARRRPARCVLSWRPASWGGGDV